MSQEPICYSRTCGAGWCQEWYESASRDARKRASNLRSLGYRVHVSSMGRQVTPLGSLAMSLVDIRDWPRGEPPPSPRLERMGGKRRSTPFAKLTRKLATRGATNPKALAAWIGRKQIGQKAMTRLAVKGKAKQHAGGKRKHAKPQSAMALARHKARMHRLRAWL